MATPKENIINAIKWLIPNLEKKFAPIKHTHTKSDITDFPTIPSSIGDLTTSSISYDSKNDLFKVYTNFEAKSNGNSLYIESENYKLTSADEIVLDSPTVTFTGGNLVVSKNNKDTCQLGTNIVDTEANGAIALYNNDLENNNSWSTSIYTQQHLTSDIVLNLPGKSGTFALTSDLPTWNSIKPNVATFEGIVLDGNGAYVYGDQTNQTGMIYFRYKANKTDTDFSYANMGGLVNGANQAWKCLPYTGGTLAGDNTTTPLTIKGTYSGTVESSIKYLGNNDNSTCWVVGQGTNGSGVDSFGFYSNKKSCNVVRFDVDGNITNNGYAFINNLIRTYYEYSSTKTGGTVDWRFGCQTATGDANWFGFTWNSNGSQTKPFYFNKDGFVRAIGEYQSTSANFFRSVYGNYGVIFRNDGDYIWILRTTSGDQYGSWKNDYVPFRMHISTTDVNFCGRYFLSDAVYNTTQSGSANMIITESHTIKRISSASKYKLDIQNINKEDDYAYNLLKLNPRQWFDKGAIERYSEYLTDEANDAIDKDKPYMENEDATQLYYGLVAEDLESAGLSEFCTYVKNKDGEKEIDSVQYDRVPILTIPILRDLVVCMQKILPTVQEQLDDNTKAEVATLLNKFNSFDQSKIVNNVYDDSKK